MKRLISCIVLLFVVFSHIDAQDRLCSMDISICDDYNLQNNDQLSLDDEIKSFITKMYEDKLYADYDFLQRHCSAELLKKLQEAYPYDAEGVVYAIWLFRSGQQDSKPDSKGLSYIQDVKTDKNDWYILSAVDIGWEFTKRLKVSNENGKIVISDICHIED